MVAVPLISRGTAIGVLGTINKTEGAFTDDDVQFLAAIANAAAVAIENARLFAVEQSRRRQLEAVRAVTDRDHTRARPQNVLRLITRHAGELLGAGPGRVWLWDEEEQRSWTRRGLVHGQELVASASVSGWARAGRQRGGAEAAA